MLILGYGEDSLTFHTLSKSLSDILNQLKDNSNPADAIIFFRPSFGRRSTSKDGILRPEFGEFDAIIGTSQAVYLVETKWALSGKMGNSKIQIKNSQVRRHKAFRAYLSEWRRKPTKDWVNFSLGMVNVLQKEVPDLSLPQSGTTLAKNLEYVLRKLDNSGSEIIDVLLFCSMSDGTTIPPKCDNFHVISHRCIPYENCNFIRL